MSINPKLEFYRFALNHKDEVPKTFKDFAIDELKVRRSSNDEKIMQKFLDYFVKNLSSDIAKSASLKKLIKLEKKASINKYLIYQPKLKSNSNIILGVINGGRYGRDGIIGDIADPEEGSQYGITKSILQYYYFLLYLPLDHHEGCFIIHSNSKEETVTNIFRNYIAKLFKVGHYNKPAVQEFCPKSFQEEFRKSAVIQSIEFKDEIIDKINTVNGFSTKNQKFTIKIEAIPEDKDISMAVVDKVRTYFENHVFGLLTKQKKLVDFQDAKISTKNTVDNSTKIFEWNSRDNEFVPVVYLNERINKFNIDETPDFEELESLCLTYLQDEILPELRPDLKVKKI